MNDLERLIQAETTKRCMVTINSPGERTCERCGRTDVWCPDRKNWIVDGNVGNPNCIHVWDINGSYNPIEK